jgi:hypothetical protein
MIGTDDFFAVAPQMIHGVQLWAPVRQPKQLDVPTFRQLLRRACNMTGILIQEHGDMAMPVTIMNLFQEGLKVFGFRSPASEHQPMTGAQIDRSKEHALGVATRNRYGRRRALSRPPGTQHGKEPQIGLVFGQKHAGRRQGSDPTTNSGFFSLSPGLRSAHSGTASTHNATHAIAGAGCSATTPDPLFVPNALAAKEASNLYSDSRRLAASASTPDAAFAGLPACTAADGLCPNDRPALRLQVHRSRHESNYATSVESRGTTVPLRKPSALRSRPTTPRPAHADRRLLVSSSIHCPNSVVVLPSSTVYSWRASKRLERSRYERRQEKSVKNLLGAHLAIEQSGDRVPVFTRSLDRWVA